MEIVRCEKGHFYDAEASKTCPQCALEAAMENSAPKTDPIGATQPVTPYGDLPETEPVADPKFTPTDFVGGHGAGGAVPVQGYDPTMPVWQNGTAGFSPVVGWLVCIEGPDRGTDYRIRNGNNFIGRAQHMDICIQNDAHISHENQAVIGYDDVDRMFFFGPAGGRNTVRVNGKMVINSVELKPYDTIVVGTTKLIFVPLCGERFDWNAQQR